MRIKELSSEETGKLRTQLEYILSKTVDKWEPYWYPLCKVKENIPVIAFDSGFIAREENFKIIRDIFVKHNISQIIELKELYNARIIESFTDEEYFLEKDGDSIKLPYMSECFWFDSNNDWILYASHECTITFGGDWLVNEVKSQINNYSKYEMIKYLPVESRDTE